MNLRFYILRNAQSFTIVCRFQRFCLFSNSTVLMFGNNTEKKDVFFLFFTMWEVFVYIFHFPKAFAIYDFSKNFHLLSTCKSRKKNLTKTNLKRNKIKMCLHLVWIWFSKEEQKFSEKQKLWKENQRPFFMDEPRKCNKDWSLRN